MWVVVFFITITTAVIEAHSGEAVQFTSIWEVKSNAIGWQWLYSGWLGYGLPLNI